MFIKVNSGGIIGIDGQIVSVEVDVSEGLPDFHMTGYLSSEVKEAQDRVKTALKNSGYKLQSKKITVNLSPANQRKEGTGFDLPIAVCILAAYGRIYSDALEGAMFVGELGLDGQIKGIPGILPLLIAAKEGKIKKCYIPMQNMNEGMSIEGISVYGVETIKQLAEHLNDPIKTALETSILFEEKTTELYEIDYSEINGQVLLKRATEIAVAGHHNILYIGPAGAGKTMVAERIPTIMPPLTNSENLEITKIYSVCNMLPEKKSLKIRRPFRNPHHTISATSLVGGGRNPKPGEISLASGGVLFLDELTEFKKSTIEALRQPLEDKRIVISRLHGTYTFPADFMLAAAMNPCRCGFFPDRSKCSCTDKEIRNYINKISKPLLDRIDICVEASPVTYQELINKADNESSDMIRKRILRVMEIQKKRFENTDILFNGNIKSRDIDKYCVLSKADREFLNKIYTKFELSARAYYKILRVARTIADLEDSMNIEHEHLCEAISYRGIEEKYWGKLK